MTQKTAVVTGVSGQDGSYLAELLLSKNYKVVGIVRRSAMEDKKYYNIEHLLENPNLILENGDLTDSASIWRIVGQYKPAEFYNLAAQSHVGASFTSPESTMEINCNGVVNCLEAIRILSPETKFYQASTSEMFGDNMNVPQSEETVFSPNSPYACAKMAAHNLVVNYRKAYNLFACSGILFNHESERRGEQFVTRKITKAMEMVAASKMRRAQERMRNARPYSEKVRNIAANLGKANPEYRPAYLVEREVKKAGVIVVTTDKGLCGGLNTNVLRALTNTMKDLDGQGVELSCTAIGMKGFQFLNRIAMITRVSNHDKIRTQNTFNTRKIVGDSIWGKSRCTAIPNKISLINAVNMRNRC